MTRPGLSRDNKNLSGDTAQMGDRDRTGHGTPPKGGVTGVSRSRQSAPVPSAARPGGDEGRRTMRDSSFGMSDQEYQQLVSRKGYSWTPEEEARLKERVMAVRSAQPTDGVLEYDEDEGWLVYTERLGPDEMGASEIVAMQVSAWFGLWAEVMFRR